MALVADKETAEVNLKAAIETLGSHTRSMATKETLYKDQVTDLRQQIASLGAIHESEMTAMQLKLSELKGDARRQQESAQSYRTMVREEKKKVEKQNQEKTTAAAKAADAAALLQSVKSEAEEVEALLSHGQVNSETTEEEFRKLMKHSVKWIPLEPDLTERSQVVGPNTKFSRTAMDNAHQLFMALNDTGSTNNGTSNGNKSNLRRQENFANKAGLIN